MTKFLLWYNDDICSGNEEFLGLFPTEEAAWAYARELEAPSRAWDREKNGPGPATYLESYGFNVVEVLDFS